MLPWELLQYQLFHYITVQEFQQLRLVCKAWNEFYLTDQKFWELNCKISKNIPSMLHKNIDWREYFIYRFFFEQFALQKNKGFFNFQFWQDYSEMNNKQKFKGFCLVDRELYSGLLPPNMLNNTLICLPNQHQIVIVGGCKQETDDTFGPFVTIFDFATQQVLQQTEITSVTLDNYATSQQPHPKLWRHTCVLYNNQLYIFGGTFSVSGIKVKYNDIFTYNLSTNEISKIQYQQPVSQIPCHRSDHCACRVLNRMYIFGGSNSSMQSMNDLYYYDLDSNLWHQVEQKGSIPPSQASASLFYLEYNNCLVLRGGSGITDQCWGDTYPKVYLFHIPSETWITVDDVNSTKDVPRAGAFAGCIIVGKYFLLSMGGNEISKTLGEAFVFDLVRCTWHSIPSLTRIINATCLKMVLIDLNNQTICNAPQGQEVEQGKEDPFIFLYGGYRGYALNYAGKIAISWVQEAKEAVEILFSRQKKG